MEKKRKKKPSNGKKHAGKASIAEKTDRLCDMLIASTKDGHSNSWFLDSGCSYHMCLNKSWFCIYKDYNEGAVLMGIDAVCKTIGIRSNKLKMFNGKAQTLTNVRHIPDPKNLISLESIESCGMKVFRR